MHLCSVYRIVDQVIFQKLSVFIGFPVGPTLCVQPDIRTFRNVLSGNHYLKPTAHGLLSKGNAPESLNFQLGKLID